VNAGNSINSIKMQLTATSAMVIPQNPKRTALIISASAADFSLSFFPGVILGQAAFNFFGGTSWTLVLCEDDVGVAIKQPMYGICGVTAQVVEVNEILVVEGML
jgi:hypothetical protein